MTNGVFLMLYISSNVRPNTSSMWQSRLLMLPPGSWKELDAVPVNKSCRSIKLLDIRAFELKSDVHQVFNHVWNTLISVDIEGHKVSISDTKQGKPKSLGLLAHNI